MPFIKSEKQKDNLARFSYDVAKIILAIIVIGPFVKIEGFNLYRVIGGFVVATLFFVFGFLLDAKEVKE